MKEADVYNNTIRVSVAAAAGIRSAGSYDSTDPIVGPVDLRIRNNIISSVNGAQLVHVTAADEGGLLWGDGGDVTFQGNLYDAASSFAIDIKGTSYTSFAASHTAGGEKNGATNLGVQADPLLVNPGTNGSAANMKTSSTSPAKNAGLNLHSLFGTAVGAIDYFSTLLPVGAFDIGAEEK